MGLGRKKGTGGGGGVGAVLTVTAPAGVTVSVSKDGKVKTKTANVDGLAVFKGLETGTWTLTITDGVQTSTKPVVITADYDTVIAFFSATINITYPAGSTCTCSDGSTTFTAPDTSGTWACIVPNTGTWTVSCTNGTESASETVSITTDGQTKTVELSYMLILFDNGEAVPWLTDTFTDNSPGSATIGNTIVFSYTDSGGAWTCAGTENSYDLSKYKTLYFDMTVTDHYDQYFGTATVGVMSKKPYANNTGLTFLASAKPTVDGTRRTVSVDISSINNGYIAIYGIMKATIYKVWCEK